MSDGNQHHSTQHVGTILPNGKYYVVSFGDVNAEGFSFSNGYKCDDPTHWSEDYKGIVLDGLATEIKQRYANNNPHIHTCRFHIHGQEVGTKNRAFAFGPQEVLSENIKFAIQHALEAYSANTNGRMVIDNHNDGRIEMSINYLNVRTYNWEG